MQEFSRFERVDRYSLQILSIFFQPNLMNKHHKIDSTPPLGRVYIYLEERSSTCIQGSMRTDGFIPSTRHFNSLLRNSSFFLLCQETHSSKTLKRSSSTGRQVLFNMENLSPHCIKSPPPFWGPQAHTLRKKHLQAYWEMLMPEVGCASWCFCHHSLEQLISWR